MTVAQRSATEAGSFLPIVDALRAVAIALVVIYHAFPAFIPGGLIGVDVFFVISGFLILGQIGRSVAAGRFSLIGFYKRRALRILPPYLLVATVTAVAACFVLVTPLDLETFHRDFDWSGGFAANFRYADVQGYFDSGATLHVLLHLWSLGVEEQFYLAAPVAMLVVAFVAGVISRRYRLAIGLVVGLLVFAWSLASSLRYSDIAPTEAFYLPRFRIWEFLVGGGVSAAIPLLRKLPGPIRDAAIIAGLALIAVAAWAYRTGTVYPGSFALLPVLGAGLVIGGGAERSSLLTRVLANPPVLWIGLVSYELYLWHWPVLVLTQIASFGELPPVAAGYCLIVVLGLAAGTHFGLAWMIGALRADRGRLRNLLVLAGVLAGYGLVVAGVSVGIGAVHRAVEARIPPLLVPVAEHPANCDATQPRRVEASCGPTASGRGLGLILGDSHAGVDFTVLSEHARAAGAGLQYASFAGCSPFLTVDRSSDSDPARCRRTHADLRKALEGGSLRIAYAIIAAQWMFHIDDLVGDSQEQAFIAGLRDDIRLLKGAGASRILVVGAPTLLRREPGDCLVRAALLGRDRDRICSAPRDLQDWRAAKPTAWIRSAIGNDPAVRFVDPEPAFCGEQSCPAALGDVALFFDHDHLSRAGVELLAGAAGKDLDWAFAAAP